MGAMVPYGHAGHMALPVSFAYVPGGHGPHGSLVSKSGW
jgi:hypothetical protein